MDEYRGAFKRALIGDPSADVEPLRVRLNAATHAERATSRSMSPAKAEWLVEHLRQLEAGGMVHRNSQAAFASVAMAIPKKDTYCMVADIRAANSLVEPADACAKS